MKLVRGILAGGLLAAFGAGLAACGPIGVPGTQLVEPEGGGLSGLNGHVMLSTQPGVTQGETRVRFSREPLPDDRPLPAGIVPVGDMIDVTFESGNLTRARVTLDYGDLPAGVRPEMLNVFAWSAELGGWLPLTGTTTDAVERAVGGDTALFDGFVLGTWQVASDATGDTIRTGSGATLPVKPGTAGTFWGYARAGAAASLEQTLEHLTGARQELSCEPKAASVTVRNVSVPAGRVDACVISGTGSQQIRVRNRFPFPMVLDLPDDGSVRPAPTSEAGSLDGVRDTILTYLDGSVAVGGGQVVTLELTPGRKDPVTLSGRLDWSVIALDSGLRHLDLLLPNSRALRGSTAEALLQAHQEFGAAARKALGEGQEGDPAVRSLLQATGLSDAGRSVADVFRFSACVLERGRTVAGSDQDVLAALKTAGPAITLVTGDCLREIYDRYQPVGARSYIAILDTLKATTSMVRKAVPKADRVPGTGLVTVTIDPN
ncbi:hypothetical protein Aca07nite_80190 [Actinoplanes capillaceus]|uniref:Lipoprotein n=1 Tax=Actinoplanes campanulatus TaxID=113559 RepID=A0ABQ3WX16_9ACTN|nr:hypothetical protein [Actinoplanes capillaceus]GID50744.1 hypothetical protein Aca07nite_80190 [Actinoplanes capillaceus]